MAVCALCRRDRELRQSHIVPKFAFDYLKRTSATGFLRFSNEPNRRVQDGRKIPMLCEECEQRFSTFEKYFSEAVFEPYNADRGVTIQYDSRLLLFAASISWRVLYFYNAHEHLDHVSPALMPSVDSALHTWRRFLLGELPHPGRFDRHILAMDELAEATTPNLPVGINRYLLRSVGMDVIASPREVMVYTKLPRIAIIGMVERVPPRNRWQSTQIAARRGTISPRGVTVPAALGNYIMDKARLYMRSIESMSERQQGVVNDAAMSDVERTAGSESMRAISADVRMFGSAAFRPDDEQ